jgi:cyclic beta-1,2-glucan synthetase
MDKAATEIDPLLSSQIDGWAIELADKLKASAPRKTSFRVPKRLKKLKRFFQTAYNHFDEGAKAQSAIPSTADWLLDNFHILEQTIRVVSHDLSPDYYARLPKTKDGWARIHVVALAITYGSARLDVEQLKHFLKIFQSTTNLKIGELWALPLMLRLAVLETLADGLAEVSQLNWDSALEPELWKGIKSASDPPKPNSETKVINSFFNLRLIGTLDWKEFVEATNVLEPILRKDPSGAYGKSDFETRNRYRGIIEDLALGSSMDEAEIASLAIQLSELGETTRERHVGYYLIAEGRPKLEKITAYRAPVRTFLRRFILRNPLLAYLGSIVLVTVIILLTPVKSTRGVGCCFHHT